MELSVRTTGQLGPLLVKLRKLRGWTQSELGRRIGLSQERISAIEKEPEKTSFDQLLTIMMVLDAEFVVRPKRPLVTEAKMELKGHAPKLAIRAQTVKGGSTVASSKTKTKW